MPNVTIWNEFRHERQNPAVRKHYPDGMHVVIARALRAHGIADVRTVTLDDPGQGLPPAILDQTDVLVWWGHKHHDEVADELVARVHDRVLAGMGLVALHSAHYSKIFRRLMGTPCTLKWRDSGEPERLWLVAPGHPVAAGLPEHFELPLEEMYGEPFAAPAPEELVFLSWFKGGEVFRSGCTYRRGRGLIFYFRPGHETFPTYHDANVQRVIANAVRYVAPHEVTREAFVNEKRGSPLEAI